jgi:predicted TIM-barrel fold metal-dependent hydrolase
VLIDFRVRPPAKSFLNLSIYTQPDWVESFFRFFGSYPDSARARSMSAFLEGLRANEVTHAVVWGRAVPDPRESTLDEDVAAIVAVHRGLFTGFGGVCVQSDPAAAVTEVDRIITGLGLKGITLEPGFGTPLRADDPKLYPVYQRCQELGGILAFTISGLVGSDLSYGDPVAVDRVAGDFPKLQVVISHAFWPWVAQSCGLAFRRPNVYLLPELYGIAMPGYLQWVEAANTYLADRLLFGSAFPVAAVERLVDGYRKLPYRQGVLEKVLYQNAARLLGL